MRFTHLCAAVICLTAATGPLPAHEPADFDFPKFFTEFQIARNKAIAAAKTPPGEQPPFESLRPHVERWAKAVADNPDGKAGDPARRQLLTYLALYPTSPRAKELLDEAARPLSAAERAGVMVNVSRALLREAGLPSHTSAEAAELNAKAEALLEKALTDAEGSVKKRAESTLYVARNLSVGKTAPAATSRDLDGNEVKLSDYRGKVVVLDFWFVGCMPCRAMIPHQRELVERLKGKPFALISVSADKEKEDLTKFLAKTEMPWVHWHCGTEDGMVADWKVTSFPTIYVLDAEGVIRFKDVRGASLDKAVDLLLAETTAKDAPPEEAPAPKDRAARLRAVKAEFAADQKNVLLAMREAKTPEALTAAIDGQSNLTAFAPRLFALVEETPGDGVSFDALTLLATTGRDKDYTTRAFKLLSEHHATRADLGPVLVRPTILRETAKPFLKQVLDRNPDRAIKARAAVALARLGVQSSERAATPEQSVTAAKEAEAMFERILDEFADVELGKGDQTAGEWARENVVVVRKLGVGRPFPDVACQDLGGKSERVSDYRGKVVVVDVWATWCGPCRAMIPHQRELVGRLKGKPFALISVSADKEKATVEKFLKATEMPWVHWWVGGEGDELKAALHIRSYPTVFVLDGRGVIRYKGVRGKKMDEAVDALLGELAAGGESSRR